MSDFVLQKSFFRQNPLDPHSAASLADFHLLVDDMDSLNEKMEKLIFDTKPDATRREKLEQAKAIIEELRTGEAVVKYMRQVHDSLADWVFCKKALLLQSEAAPLIQKRFMTTGQDRFIELAFRIFAKADIQYTNQLYADYKSIRNPYAQAYACLLFAEREIKDAGPLLLAEFKRFRRDYPDGSFDQFPLLGLNILYGYDRQKKHSAPLKIEDDG